MPAELDQTRPGSVRFTCLSFCWLVGSVPVRPSTRHGLGRESDQSARDQVLNRMPVACLSARSGGDGENPESGRSAQLSACARARVVFNCLVLVPLEPVLVPAEVQLDECARARPCG